VALYAALAGGVALRRHQHLQSQALDMGYAGQVTWNAMRGNGLRFTVFRGPVGAERGQPLQFGPGADRDSLFAFHVELLFFPISLLYRINAAPETLIVLLTAVLALGAVPVYLIAGHLLRHRGAALAFSAMYLLTPSIQAANVADFHAVSLTPTVLLLAFLFLITRRDVPFCVCAAVAAAAKEEVGLLVGAMGLYAWVVQRRRRFGPAVAVLACAWVALCFLVIIPRFSGGASSLFVDRYGEARHLLRRFPATLLSGRPDLPVPDYTVHYAVNLLAGTGFLALFGPPQLILAAPILAVNGLSGSTWQHGGGAHYSAEVVPALIVAAIFGTRSLSGFARRRLAPGAPRGPVPRGHTVLAVALAGLVVATAQSWRNGVLPPAARFAWPVSGAVHAAVAAPLLAQIPPDAAVSAQSNLHPHLSSRPRLYVYPAVEDAEYVVLDVAGTSDPLFPDALFPAASTLLDNPAFDLLGAADGLLLFRRRPGGAPGPPTAPVAALAAAPPDAQAPPGTTRRPPPPSFYSFTRPRTDEPYSPVRAALGDLFDVVGYRVEPLPEVDFIVRRARLTLFVRARRPADRTFRFTPFIVQPDGFTRIFDDGTPTQLWVPTERWRPGEVMRLAYPPLTYRSGDRLGIGAQIGVEPVAPRLTVHDADRPVADGARVVVLGPLP
jgi:uncharacterized membrane protein